MEQSSRCLLFAVVIISFPACLANFTCNIGDAKDCYCAKIVQPTSETVLSDTTSTLGCTVLSAIGDEVQWVQGDTPLGTKPDIPSNPRYSMSTTDGDYSLIIANVSIGDENSYWCQIPACATAKPATPAQLTVYAPPEEPIIDNDIDDYINVISGEKRSWLVCSANNAKPAATVRWYNFDSGILLSDGVSTKEVVSGKLTSTTVSYEFQPAVNDSETTYLCEVSGAALDLQGTVGGLRKTVTIFVTEKPEVFTTRVTNGSTFVVDENMKQTVTCEATGFKGSDAKIIWSMSNNPNNSSENGSFCNGTYCSESVTIFGNRSNDGAVYKCSITIYGYGNIPTYNSSLFFTISVYSFPYAAVIGGSIGGAILLILLIILLICLMRRSKRKKRAEEETRVNREIQTIANEPVVDEDDRTSQRPVEEPKVEPSIEMTLKAADQGYITESETSEVTEKAPDEESSSEAESDMSESVGPPSGDTFSISSSMMRSDRGSPIMMYSDLDEESTYSNEPEIASVSIPYIKAPIYYTRETGNCMLTDV